MKKSKAYYQARNEGFNDGISYAGILDRIYNANNVLIRLLKKTKIRNEDIKLAGDTLEVCLESRREDDNILKELMNRYKYIKSNSGEFIDGLIESFANAHSKLCERYAFLSQKKRKKFYNREGKEVKINWLRDSS